MKQTFKQLAKGFNKISNEQIIVVIKHIVNSKMDSSDKRILIEDFILEWFSIEDIKIRILDIN